MLKVKLLPWFCSIGEGPERGGGGGSDVHMNAFLWVSTVADLTNGEETACFSVRSFFDLEVYQSILVIDQRCTNWQEFVNIPAVLKYLTADIIADSSFLLLVCDCYR